MARHWLMKSEPDVFSIDDLAKAKKQTTGWQKVRNYQARNLLRDEIAVGDGVLYYHSSVDPPAVVGLARVVKAGYPDPTQFNPKSEYYDAGQQARRAPVVLGRDRVRPQAGPAGHAVRATRRPRAQRHGAAAAREPTVSLFSR